MRYRIYQEKCPYRLRSCVWEITLACCFSCRYCGSRAGQKRENELITEECLQVASQLADLGCHRVSLIGGEVFMRSDWPIIAKSLTDRGVRVSIITNGFLFSEDLIQSLKQADVESIAVSLDGPEPIHDRFRQEGSFHRAINAIDVLTANGISVSVITTLHTENVSHLEEMYQMIRSKPIFAWQLQACSPMGNASSDEFSTTIDFMDVIRFVESHLESAPFSIGVADNIGYYTPSELKIRGNVMGSRGFSGCRAGLNSVGIDSVGNVRGCESMYDDFFVEGNLREKSLKEIWEDPNAFSYNRRFDLSRLEGKCSDCRYGSRCAGGCRSYNYFTSGKLYDSVHCARDEENSKQSIF